MVTIAKAAVTMMMLISRFTRGAAWSSTKYVGGYPHSHNNKMMTTMRQASPFSSSSSSNGKLLVLGGTGYLGQAVCQRAVQDGYAVTSLSRRGLPPSSSTTANNNVDSRMVDYRQGDARQKSVISSILNEGGYTGLIHCIGLLFDEPSGLGSYNRLVSGSGSLPDAESTYDTITRLTAFHAMDAAMEYAQASGMQPFPFGFTSAAEAGWPEVTGGSFVESNLAPDFLKRYLAAKRAVETRLLASTPVLRPIIVRPSLIYSTDRPMSFPSVGAFFVGNALGLPFVDRPVTVQAVSTALVRAVLQPQYASVQGILRYPEMDRLASES
jgi:nucleoside-diphosphate-sugar epimerase